MFFKRFLLGAAAAAPFALCPVQVLAQDGEDNAILTDVILVTADVADGAIDSSEPPHQIALPADSGAIAARMPGAAAIGNGALSGQLSYRGLFGERVLGRVNGQRFATGGPNAMDPPLHYAPSILVDRIEVARGVAPVSQGPSLAGAVNAELVEVPFASGSSPEVHGRIGAQYRSVDDSYAAGGALGLSTSNWRIGVIASREEGSDYEFDGGTVASSSFERTNYGVHAGMKLGDGEIFAEYRRNETDPTGNPAFPMDIQYFNTDFLRGGYSGQLTEKIGLKLMVGHVSVRHLMDNYSLRDPDPAVISTRATFADADTTTAEGSLRFGSATRNVSVGGDVELVEKYVRITNPFNANFFVEAQPDLTSDRYGAFVQWRGGAGPAEFELGARIDRTEQAGGIPELGSAVPMGPVGLANAFAASARAANDTTFDAVLRLWLPGDEVTPRIMLARKTRVPSLLERFGWLPTSASFGLADGNIYVGNQALDPEVAWIAEAGFDVDAGPVSFRPTVFYRRVDDYIQGTPFDTTPGVINTPVEMVANMNGDATPLMFRNVDAELYGVDVDFTVEASENLLFEGSASFVRAKRRDIADNLYRVPPANARLAAIWQQDRWSLGAEVTAADDQDHVSLSNDETSSDGYLVVGLFGSLAVADGITLDAGVENLFDAYYQPHLSGVNRVGASDVPLGERLPGPGRGVWVRTRIAF